MSFASPSASQSTTPNPGGAAVAAPPPAPAADPFAAFMSQSNSGKQAVAAAAPAAEDDEWNFSSALPETSAASLPKEHRGTITDSSIRAEFLANRTTASSPAIDMLFSFSNNTAQPISELHFQLAVTKVGEQIHSTHPRYEDLC